MHPLDPHSHLDSPVHHLPAAAKLVGAVAMVILLVLWPIEYLPYMVAPAALLAFIAALSRIPATFLLKRLLLLEPFVLGVAVMALFQPGGWRLFVVLLVRSTLCLLTMILLSNTTPFAQMLRVLHALRVPSLLITTLALMYRYIFVLSDEAERMKRARLSRTFSSRGSRNWRTRATVVSQLFIRASERAERIYAAMCARGFR